MGNPIRKSITKVFYFRDTLTAVYVESINISVVIIKHIFHMKKIYSVGGLSYGIILRGF